MKLSGTHHSIRILQALLINSILLLAATAAFAKGKKTYNINDFGAIGDGHTLNTAFINNAINKCYSDGGGTVIIPKGVYITATVFLKSNVNIILEDDAKLQGINDIDQYKPFIPTTDLAQFNTISSSGTNSNSAYDTVWTKALIIGSDIHNVTISGKGVIDGEHVFNANGEEHMRGPHAIILANAHDITFKNITVEKASNYAILGYGLENFDLENATIREGWDGIHIRGGKNVTVKNCTLQTGDDAIAGGYWDHFNIYDSHINSACNGMRIIMPVTDVHITHCDFEGPGKFPHRTSGKQHRTNMIAGIYMQPGGWGAKPGDLKNIKISDLKMHDMDRPFAFDLNEGNNATDITIENITADKMKGPIYMHSGAGGYFDNIVFKNITVDFLLNRSEKSRGLDLYNVRNFYSKDIKFRYKNN